jgi:hypothetical protein
MSIAALDSRLVAPASPPPLRVLQGGRAAVPVETYRRRRLAVGAATLAVAALLVVGVATGFGFLLGPVQGGSAPAQDAPVAPGGAETVVVQPGDTLWSVARRLEPEGDVREAVDRLAAVNGGPQLEVGQVLVLP